MHANTFAAALAAGILAAATASAGQVVDVDNLLLRPAGSDGSSGFAADTFFDFSVAQTWTVGVAGQLDTIDLIGAVGYGGPFEPFDVTLSVYRGVGGASWGGATLAGSITRTSSDIPIYGVSSFDFSSFGIHAGVGDVLTWEMSVADCDLPCSRSWSNETRWFPSGATTASYAGGSVYSYSPSIGLIPQFDDGNFRITMDVVPEPGTWTLMILGFGGVGASLRGRARPAAVSR